MPSLVVPSGNTPSTSPARKLAAMRCTTRMASRRDSRSTNNVPMPLASWPIKGHCLTSALETNRQNRAACTAVMSSHDMWLATSITGPVTAGWPWTITFILSRSSMAKDHAWVRCSRCSWDKLGNTKSMVKKARRICSSARISLAQALKVFNFSLRCESHLPAHQRVAHAARHLVARKRRVLALAAQL